MNGTAEMLTFDEHLKHWAAERPDRLALQQADRCLNFAQLEERTAKIVAMLLGLGLQKGDRIAWIGKNSDLYFSLFYGAARVGIVIVPIGWRLAPAEWKYIVGDTQAKIVFTGDGFEGVKAALADGLPHLQQIVSSADALAMIEAAQRCDFVATGADDPALQLYTSGTTGNPKGAVLTNRNLFGLRKPAESQGLAYTKWDDDEAVLVAMPCAHIGGTGLGILAIGSGLPAIIQSEFTPDGFFDAVENNGVTRLFIVPAALQILLNHPRCATVDYSNLRYILYGAAPIPLELLRECMTMFGAQFIQAYGLTETTGTVVMLPPEDHDPNGNARMRSAGKPLPGVELRAVDAEGNDVPTGEVGEILIRSPSTMQEYWNLGDATKNAISDDGWFRSGDAGYLDEDGYLFIHDRVKDMIITGGENVYPAEVESAIYGHPDVLEFAVIGVPDKKWGESVKAVCVPKAGHSIDPESIFTWARERIAGFKTPRSVDIIDALPRNASGKILRKDLRAPYWEGFDRQVN